jgi:hypothetical protein
VFEALYSHYGDLSGKYVVMTDAGRSTSRRRFIATTEPGVDGYPGLGLGLPDRKLPASESSSWPTAAPAAIRSSARTAPRCILALGSSVPLLVPEYRSTTSVGLSLALPRSLSFSISLSLSFMAPTVQRPTRSWQP